ncbi:CHAD domain-containing protein [Lysobacter terrae]
MAKVARSPADTFGPALRDYAIHELDMAREGLARTGHVHAGTHQARKAIRRARAVLALGEARLGVDATLIDRALRTVNRDLSELRDAHALVEVLERLAERAHDPADRQLLRQAVRRARRASGRVKKRHAQERQAAEESLAALRASLQGLPWSTLTWPECQAAIARSAERARSVQERARNSDKDARWHRWRRRVRLLVLERRACSQCGMAAVAELRFDQHLAEQLGVAGELTLVLERCGRASPFKRSERAPLRRFAAKALKRQRRRILSVLPRQ